MPPEPLPWDRKDFFQDRKHDRSSDSVGFVSRWRDNPHYGSSSSREINRWGSADFRSRPPGGGKQGGWHPYSEDSGHGFTPSRTNEKILGDEGFRPSGYRSDGKYSRNNRENRASFGQKDWKGHSWENGSFPNGSGRPFVMGDHRSVDMVTPNSHPHSEFTNTWGQVHLKDQHDNTSSVNGLGTGKRFDREHSLGSIDWKPLKWTRSGSLSSRSSGLSHSSSPKSMGVDSSEMKADVQLRGASPVPSPSGDAAAFETSAAPSEETNSRKKPRLGWGDGLAKYEKKKVPDDNVTEDETVVCGSMEPLHSQVSNLTDKSPRVAGYSYCASPATPSSVACSSSPGLEEKPFVKLANVDNDTSNVNRSPCLPSQNHLEGNVFNLENIELAPIAKLSSSISELLLADDPFSVDSSSFRSTAMKKLLVWKGESLKALEMTESEIDSLENELKSLKSEPAFSCPGPATSSSFQQECQAKPCEDLFVDSNFIPRPAPLQLVSSGDMVMETAVGGLGGEHAHATDEDIDSPGTVTSKFVEVPSSANDCFASKPVKIGESSGDLDPSKYRNPGVKCSVYSSNEEMEEGLAASEGGGLLMASKHCDSSPFGASSQNNGEHILYELILASNKDSANRASFVFNKLLPSDRCQLDISGANIISSWPNDLVIKEKFAMRKHFLIFKERVITLKFRALQHLWKEDLRLLSMRKYRAKSQKRLELSSRTALGCHQKHRSSTRSRFSFPAGNLSLVPTTEIINFTSKLLSDSQVKPYRDSLKMPAIILDKETKISRFISSNGLVEDPCIVEKERALINPWTTEEKEIFMDKLATFGKDFRKIASFLDHKTTADCVDFYYKNHKLDCFVKTKKKPEYAKQGKFFSTYNYLVTSGKRWNRETNAASLDMLGAASAIAANADDSMDNQQQCRARFLLGVTPRGGDGTVERSGSLGISDTDRETVAVDVLAGICGSLSSEAMSSCITSSLDPGESYHDWKCQKAGSLTRRAFTPDITQNADDETCSDESCGEMNPTDWTDEEKSIFVEALSSYGKDFTMISRYMRTRSRDQCKVFFSKARKCLGLDVLGPRPGEDGIPGSDNANGGGYNDEDACVVEAGSVICREKTGSKMDEDVMLSDLDMNDCDLDPSATTNNNQTEEVDRGDHEIYSDVLQADCTPELEFEGDSTMESGVDSMSLAVQAHKIAVLSTDTEVERDDATEAGTYLKEPVSAEEANDHGLSISGVKGDGFAVCHLSTEHLISEPKGQQLASENNVNDKQEENKDANTSGLNCCDQNLCNWSNTSDCAADTSMEFGSSPKQEQKIVLELNPLVEPLVISPGTEVSLVKENSVTMGSPESRYKETLYQDTPFMLDSEKEKVIDKQCRSSSSMERHNGHKSAHSVLGSADSCQILRGYPLPVSANKEMNVDVIAKNLASLQSISEVESNLHSGTSLSQECFLQKCNSSTAQRAVSELPFLSQKHKSSQSRPHSWSSSDTERPCRNGDFKLFGQILSHPMSLQKPSSGIHEGGDKGVQHPKPWSKNFETQLLGAQSVDSNPAPTKFEPINYVGLDNIPMSYGFWDGSRIQTGFSTLPDSAILLKKYPGAFGNYSSSTSMEQQSLHSVVKNSGHNLNGVPVFSGREIISSNNGGAEYQLYRNREGRVLQPFTVDMKQRQEIILSEIQRRNGFDAISGMQQQAKGGMVGINVVGRGGILVGGACNGVSVSDPVAAIKMHYAKTDQYSGQSASILRDDESWRGKGDLGR